MPVQVVIRKNTYFDSVSLMSLSTKANRVVWRGVAQTDLDYAPTDAQREQVIRDAAHELIKRLPLKK